MTTVSDLSIDEFKTIIREVVLQTMGELLADPDQNLELQDHVIARLETALREPQQTYAAEDVANELGLDW